MDKLTAIKIKYNDGTYSDEIPISALAENVEWNNSYTLVDILGEVAYDTKGSIQDQISQLFNEKVNIFSFASLEARVDNIIATSGDDNTQIVDARLDINNIVHDTAGQAIRSQINDLKENLGYNYTLAAMQTAKAYSSSNGNKIGAAKYICTTLKIPVTPGDKVTIKIKPDGYNNVAYLFWNSTNTFLSSDTIEYFTNKQLYSITVPEDASQMGINIHFPQNVTGKIFDNIKIYFNSYKTYGLNYNENDYPFVHMFYSSDTGVGTYGSLRWMSIHGKIKVKPGDKITFRNLPSNYKQSYVLFWNFSEYLSNAKMQGKILKDGDYLIVPQNANLMMVEFSLYEDIEDLSIFDNLIISKNQYIPLPINYLFNQNDLLNDIDPSSKILEYTNLSLSSNGENFIFYTDPHLKGPDDRANRYLNYYMVLLQKYYNFSPTDFVLCGGDWLTSGDTISEAKYKLGYIDGFTQKMFKNHYMILGNHDLNYQGYDDQGRQYYGELSQTVVNNLWFRKYQNAYYYFDGNVSRFYVLDSGIVDTSSVLNNRYLDVMTNYRWEQIDWLANQLLTNEKTHSIITLHMYKTGSNVTVFSQQLNNLIIGYNNRQNITLNSKSYNFTNCTGHIEFVLAGHTHADGTHKIGTVPVIITTWFFGDGIPTFDLMHINYSDRKIYCIRVGAGSNRTFDLDTGELIE